MGLHFFTKSNEKDLKKQTLDSNVPFCSTDSTCKSFYVIYRYRITTDVFERDNNINSSSI